MKFTITLKDTRDGFLKEYQDTYDWEDDYSCGYLRTAWECFNYQWTEGNNGCDCNRMIFMYGWEDETRPCSTGLIEVVKIVDQDGNEYKLES